MPLKWDLPGGKILPGETVEEAIRREVKEETQLTIRIGQVIHVYSNIDQVPKRQTFQIVYLAEYISGKVILNPTEHTSYRWLRYEEIAGLDAIAFLKDLVDSYKPPSIL
jgi:8-oxo-dGTP diphosphatase